MLWANVLLMSFTKIKSTVCVHVASSNLCVAVLLSLYINCVFVTFSLQCVGVTNCLIKQSVKHSYQTKMNFLFLK